MIMFVIVMKRYFYWFFYVFEPYLHLQSPLTCLLTVKDAWGEDKRRITVAIYYVDWSIAIPPGQPNKRIGSQNIHNALAKVHLCCSEVLFVWCDQKFLLLRKKWKCKFCVSNFRVKFKLCCDTQRKHQEKVNKAWFFIVAGFVCFYCSRVIYIEWRTLY